jgi:aminopeptidase YwaD
LANQLQLSEKAETYLRRLCLDIPSRRVGSAGNRAATDFFAAQVASFGFATETPTFDCMDWREDGVALAVGGFPFEAFASPYSPGCRVRAALAAASTLAELETLEAADSVVLLHGEIARQQLMPKNFPFYNPDEHKRIIQALEAMRPAAIIAATSRDPEMVGSLYPFPLIEDGDFDIPSVYMTDRDGERLVEHIGEEVTLESRATRIPATSCNVIARKGPGSVGRVVLCAHIDAKIGTPGATDNASGVAVLLLLAELLKDYAGGLGIEVVALNGEDYYSNPGEQQVLALNAGRWDEIVLGVNIDGAGYQQGDTAYSLYECPADLAGMIRSVFAPYQQIVEGAPWIQGDHMLFLVNQRPALALTSERMTQLLAEITHTPKDSPEVVDGTKLADIALALHSLLARLDPLYGASSA